MTTVLITGSNRGIGLELAKQYHHQGATLISLCRQASQELKSLAGVMIIENVDVANFASVEKACKQLKGHHIDILINNAGLLRRTGIDTMTQEVADVIDRQFKTNALGPLFITSQCLPYLTSGSKVILITSRMGSIDDNTSGSHYGYRMSKTALNSAGKSLSIDLKDKGIAVGIIHPGWIQTEMTGHTGNDTPDTAAKQIIDRINELSLENTGTFWHANGSLLPW